MEQISCDNCKVDLTTTTNSINYRLALVNQRIPCKEGSLTDMMVYPPIQQDAHFCGLGCLKTWLNNKTN